MYVATLSIRRLAVASLLALAVGACTEHSQPLEPDASAVLLAKGQGSGASAAQRPEFEILHIDEGDPDIGICPFPVAVHSIGTVRIKRMLHPATGLVREVHTFPSLTITLSANGRTLSTRSAGADVLLIDPTTDELLTLTVAGVLARFTVPGGGVILLDAGRIVFQDGGGGPVIWEAGPHQLFGTEPDIEKLCAYLAG